MNNKRCKKCNKKIILKVTYHNLITFTKFGLKNMDEIINRNIVKKQYRYCNKCYGEILNFINGD